MPVGWALKNAFCADGANVRFRSGAVKRRANVGEKELLLYPALAASANPPAVAAFGDPDVDPFC